MTWAKPSSSELYHHGIKGQKWGKRNGPPYPLGSGQASASEKKAGWKERSIEKKIKMIDEVRENVKNIDINHDTEGKDQTVKNIVNLALAAISLNPINMYRASKKFYDNAKSKNKTKKFDEERKNAPIDKKTGFRKKTTELTQEQDMERVNPEFGNFNTNTKNNCMLCTSAYELRRRGFDVRAKKAGVGYYPEDVKKWFPGAEIERFAVTNKKQVNAVYDALKKQGVGARGNFMVSWKGSLGGHSVAYEVTSDGVTLYDTQANKKYSSINKIVSHSWLVEIARLDNCKINYKSLKEIAE